MSEVTKLYEMLCSEYEELTYGSENVTKFVKSYISIFNSQNLVIDEGDMIESFVLSRQIYIYACKIIKKTPKKKKGNLEEKIAKKIINEKRLKIEKQVRDDIDRDEKEIEELKSIYDPKSDLETEILTEVYADLNDEEFRDMVNEKTDRDYLKELRKRKRDDDEKKKNEIIKKIKIEELT